MFTRLSFSLVLVFMSAASSVSAGQSGSGWRRVQPEVSAPVSNPLAVEFQQIGDVRFRMPAGWNRSELAKPGRLALSSKSGDASILIFPSRELQSRLDVEFEGFLRTERGATLIDFGGPPDTLLRAFFGGPGGSGPPFEDWLAIRIGSRAVFFGLLARSREDRYNYGLAALNPILESISLADGARPGGPSRQPTETPAAPPAGPSAPLPRAGTAAIQAVSSQRGIGAKFGARDPRACPSNQGAG